MMLSRYFSLSEMTFSEKAVRKSIDNTPNADTLENLKDTCQQADRVREYLGVPMAVSSGYRSPKLNAAIGGSKTSSHMQGLAMDFRADQFGAPKDIFAALKKSGIQFDQLILEFPDSANGGWVHIGFGPEMRGQKLVFDGRQYSLG